MTNFSDALASLVNRERMAAQGDPARTADLIERVAHCLALTIALTTPGPNLGELLAGVENAIYESVADASPIAALIPKERSRS